MLKFIINELNAYIKQTDLLDIMLDISASLIIAFTALILMYRGI